MGLVKTSLQDVVAENSERARIVQIASRSGLKAQIAIMPAQEGTRIALIHDGLAPAQSVETQLLNGSFEILNDQQSEPSRISAMGRAIKHSGTGWHSNQRFPPHVASS